MTLPAAHTAPAMSSSAGEAGFEIFPWNANFETGIDVVDAQHRTLVALLNRMAQQAQTAIIVVTHDEKIIPTFKRIYHIRDGVTHEEVGEGRGFD